VCVNLSKKKFVRDANTAYVWEDSSGGLSTAGNNDGIRLLVS